MREVADVVMSIWEQVSRFYGRKWAFSLLELLVLVIVLPVLLWMMVYGDGDDDDDDDADDADDDSIFFFFCQDVCSSGLDVLAMSIALTLVTLVVHCMKLTWF